ncbi:MAG TPA: CHASE domain-containing protein [Roseateles sp.]
MFTASLSLTFFLAAASMQRNAAERRELFEHRIQTLKLSLAGAMRGQLDLLPALRLTASGPAPLDDARFSLYADSVLDAGRYPGLILSFVAERVDAGAREAYLQRVRADRSADPAGHPSFDIQPPGTRPEYMLLRHQYPADPTNDGYDLFDPGQSYRQAVERAIDAGRLTATAPLLLARDRHRPGHPELTSIVVRAAVYRDGRLPASVAERRAAATGVVGIAFRSAELVRSALPAGLTAEARVRVTDAGSPTPVFDSEPGAVPPATALSFELPLADRRWRVDVAPLPPGRWQDADEDTLAVLIAGAVCAASLAALTSTLIRRRPLSARAGGDAVQWRSFFERSLLPVLNIRPGGGIVAANPAACELFARSETELIASARADILDLDDPRLDALLARRAAHGRAQGHVRMRRPDGRLFEAEISVVVHLDGEGRELASVIVRDLEAAAKAEVLDDWR